MLRGVTKIEMTDSGKFRIEFESPEKFVDCGIKLSRNSISFEMKSSPALAAEYENDYFYENLSGVIVFDLDGPAFALELTLDDLSNNLELDFSGNHIFKLVTSENGNTRNMVLDFYSQDGKVGLVGNFDNDPISLIFGSNLEDGKASLSLKNDIKDFKSLPKVATVSVEWQLPHSLGFDVKVDKWHKYAKFNLETDEKFVFTFENNVKRIPSIAIISDPQEQKTKISITVDQKEKIGFEVTSEIGHFELEHSYDFPVQKILVSGGISPPRLHLAVNEKEIRIEVNSLLKGWVIRLHA